VENTQSAQRSLRASATTSSAAPASRYLLFGVIFVTCLSTMVLQASSDGEWRFWASQFVVFGVLLNYLAVLRSRQDIFEPVILVAGVFTLAFALRGILLRSVVDPTLLNSWVAANLHLLGTMSLYTTVGLTVFVLSYYLPLGSRMARCVPKITTTWNMDLLCPRAIIVYCCCLPAKLLTILPAGTFGVQETLAGSLGNVIGLMASLGDVALMLCGISYYYHRKQGVTKGRTAYYAILLTQLLAGFLTGYREPLIISVLAALFVRHYMWKPLRARTAVAGFLAAVMIVTPMNRAYRRLVWEQQQTPLHAVSNLSQEVAAHADRTERPREDTLAAFGLAGLMDTSNRLHGADSMITCMATVPEHLPYQEGRTLYLLPVTVFVPRALWPGKPKIGLGTFFRENIWKGPANESDSGGQIAMTQLGELYINFGLWGIVIGMAILGVLHRFAYSYLIDGHPRGSYGVLLFYFAAVLCFLAAERNFAFSYGYLLKMLVFVYLLCRYLNSGPVFVRRKRRLQQKLSPDTTALRPGAPESGNAT